MQHWVNDRGLRLNYLPHGAAWLCRELELHRMDETSHISEIPEPSWWHRCRQPNPAEVGLRQHQIIARDRKVDLPVLTYLDLALVVAIDLRRSDCLRNNLLE